MKIRLFRIMFITAAFILNYLFFGCASALVNPNTEQGQYNDLSLKYPVVLAHGIARSDHDDIKHNPWGRIPDILSEHGVEIYYGNTDAWGLIETNAELLKITIDKILKETGKKKVNIIAHSKGGLDARYMIWKYNYGDKVASLTTISTPHHGSPIADHVKETRILNGGIGKLVDDVLEELYDDVFPDPHKAADELTTENLKEFNKLVTMDDRVYYQCIYSTMDEAADDKRLAASYDYIKKIEGANDGMVSEISAKWGNNIIKIDGRISHRQIVDSHKDGDLGEVVFDIYLGIIKNLKNKGF